MRFTLDNRSGYCTQDLHRFLARGFHHWFDGSRERGTVQVVVLSSPIRSRGCANVGGRRMVLAIASPSRYSLRRFARLFDHEAAHIKGMQHHDMPKDMLYSLGRVPHWARDIHISYLGKAPDQLNVIANSSKKRFR